MEYEIIWTDPASEQLEAIHTYIAEDNPRAAQDTVAAIMASVELLRTTPRMGSIYRPDGKAAIRKVVSGKYRIFYRVVEESKRVEVLLVWHGSRQEPDLPR